MKNSGPFSEYHLMILLTYYIDNKRPSADEIAEIAEKLNGRLAMLGVIAAIGAYAVTGQLIPGVF